MLRGRGQVLRGFWGIGEACLRLYRLLHSGCYAGFSGLRAAPWAVFQDSPSRNALLSSSRAFQVFSSPAEPGR